MKQRHQVKKKNKLKPFLVILTLSILILAFSFFNPFTHKTANDKHGWQLMLVNSEYDIPKNYTVSLIELSNGQKVDERIYPDLQALFDHARQDGLNLFVAAGFRSDEEQQKLLDDKIAAYKQEGQKTKKATELAKQWVATPGTSEHQLGIAVDINADNTVSSDDAVYSWLYENSYQYGFVKRYPENKTDITGISNEPWHYRYVGKEAAKIMVEQDLVLEEYLKTLK